MVKIVCLGNEFLKEDCFAKEVGILLEDYYDVINIKDSFELVSIVSSGEDFIILDVAQGLEEVVILKLDDLRGDSIVSAHDLDAGFVLKLLDVDIDIIGIPMSGDAEQIKGEVLRIILDLGVREKL